TRCLSDWSSDVCSSDLGGTVQANLSGDIVNFGVALNNLAGGQVIAPTGGTVNVNAALNNAGTLVVSGGTLNLNSAFTTAQLGTRSEERRVGKEGRSGWW